MCEISLTLADIITVLRRLSTHLSAGRAQCRHALKPRLEPVYAVGQHDREQQCQI